MKIPELPIYNTVVEVGCGPIAGPRFDGATQHVIVDREWGLVYSPDNTSKGYGHIVGDAGNLPQFLGGSVDAVLARNVIGDPYLGTDYEDETDPEALRIALLSEEQVVTFVDDRRDKIMREAGRILRPGGPFVMVENITPAVADDYIQRLGCVAPAPLGEIVEVDIADVVPANYVDAHQSPNTRTWVTYRQ